MCTTEDAFNCFMGTDLDALVVGSCLMIKKEQNTGLIRDYKELYELD